MTLALPLDARHVLRHNRGDDGRQLRGACDFNRGCRSVLEREQRVDRSMPFTFYCPQGHLLQGMETQMGQQSQCPYCGSIFVVPTMPGAPAPGPAAPQGPGFPGAYPQHPGVPQGGMPQPGMHMPPAQGFPGVGPGASNPMFDPNVMGAQQPVDVFDPGQVAEAEIVEDELPPDPRDDPNRIIRIVCPEGHELPTPQHMLDQDAMCPQCGSLFRLRYEDSLEYKAEKEVEREQREKAFGKKALNWAIATAVIVGVAILAMIIMLANS